MKFYESLVSTSLFINFYPIQISLMLIAVNRRDFMLETRRKSKKINTIDALTSLSEIYSIDHYIQVILHTYTTTYTYANRVNYIEIANGIRSTFYSNVEHETWNRYRVILDCTFSLFPPTSISRVNRERCREDGLLRTSGWLSG